MGPPESPWHESLPPLSSPAQTMEACMDLEPYAFLQLASVTTGTETCMRTRGDEPPEDSLPKPKKQ